MTGAGLNLLSPVIVQNGGGGGWGGQEAKPLIGRTSIFTDDGMVDVGHEMCFVHLQKIYVTQPMQANENYSR